LVAAPKPTAAPKLTTHPIGPGSRVHRGGVELVAKLTCEAGQASNRTRFQRDQRRRARCSRPVSKKRNRNELCAETPPHNQCLSAIWVTQRSMPVRDLARCWRRDVGHAPKWAAPMPAMHPFGRWTDRAIPAWRSRPALLTDPRPRSQLGTQSAPAPGRSASPVAAIAHAVQVSCSQRVLRRDATPQSMPVRDPGRRCRPRVVLATGSAPRRHPTFDACPRSGPRSGTRSGPRSGPFLLHHG